MNWTLVFRAIVIQRFDKVTRAFRICQEQESNNIEFQPILIGPISENKSPGTSPGDVKAVSRILLPQRDFHH